MKYEKDKYKRHDKHKIQLENNFKFMHEFAEKYPRAIQHILSDMEKTNAAKKSVKLPNNSGQLSFTRKNGKTSVKYTKSIKKPKSLSPDLIREVFNDIKKEEDIKRNQKDSLITRGIGNPYIDRIISTSFDDVL